MMFRAEVIKMKRSAIWSIAVVLPLLAVITGSVNFYGNQDQLTNGFASLTSQITLFYSLLFFSIGIACLAAAIWRMEHQGTNWNLLLATTDRPLAMLSAKVLAIGLGVLIMQMVLITLAHLSGFVILGPGIGFDRSFVTVSLLVILTAFPLIGWQSFFSLVTKSFALPIVICLVGCIGGIALVLNESWNGLIYLLPQAINTYALQIGSTATSMAGELTWTTILPLFGASLAHTVLSLGASLIYIRRVKLR